MTAHHHDGAADGASRSAFGLLIGSPYGAYFGGKMLWATGVWVFNITSAILMYSLTSSAFLVGLVTFVQYLPLLALSPFSGARADMGDARRQAAAARAVMAVGSGALGIRLLVGGGSTRATIAVLLLAALVFGIGDAMGAPAAQALVPSLVRRDELPTAIELDAIPFTLARAVGPVLGAAIAVAISSASAYLYTAAVCLIFAIVLTRLRPERDRRQDFRTGDGSVREGLRYLRTQPLLMVLLVGVTAVGFGVDPIVTLMPSLVSELGGDPEVVAFMASAFGTGAGVMLLLLRFVRRRLGSDRVATLGLSLLASMLVLLMVVTDVSAALVAVGFAGAGYSMAITSLTTLLQSNVEERMRGRIMSFWSVTYFGTRPIAATVHGAIADLASVRVALLLTVAIVVTGAVTLGRRVRLP